MKNLANCKPSEFLAQTFKIKKSLQEWLDVTKLMEIRKTYRLRLAFRESLTAKKYFCQAALPQSFLTFASFLEPTFFRAKWKIPRGRCPSAFWLEAACKPPFSFRLWQRPAGQSVLQA